MATKTEYLTFYIVLNDPELVKHYQALYPVGVNRAPYNPNVNGTGVAGGAAVEFGAPFHGYTDYGLTAPYSWTPWSGYGTQGGPYPLDVATFQRKTGGFFGLFGTTTRYYWVGQFVLASPATAQIGGNNPTTPTNIGSLYWIEGFEASYGGPSSLTSLPAGMHITRDASRHVGGFGLALRGCTTSAAGVITLGGGAGKGGWERFYVRLRNKPTGADVPFWAWENTVAGILGGDGVQLRVTATGDIVAYNVDNGSGSAVYTNIGTVCTLEQWNGRGDHHAWVRLDCIITFVADTSAPTGTGVNPSTGPLVPPKVNAAQIQFWVNGVYRTTVSGIGSTGLNRSTAKLRLTRIGNPTAAANDLELDIDDWKMSDIPAVGGAFSVTGKDWLNGTKIIGAFPQSFSGTHSVNWTGDIRVLSQLQPYTATTGPTLNSSTALAQARALVDVNMLKRDKQAIAFGSFAITTVTTRGINNGQMGYKLNGGADVLTACASGAARTYANQMVNNSPAAADYTPLTSLELIHEKGNDANAATLGMLMAQIEAIGIFGPEDYRATENGAEGTPTFPDFVGIHNSAYPLSQYVQDAAAPVLGPYIVQAGTYNGNSTGQDILFRAPVNWIFIRNVTDSTFGAMWWTGMIGAHTLFNRGVDAALTGEEEDLTFAPVAAEDQQQQRYRMKLAGASQGYNLTGKTYAYVAVCDPAGRYMLNGAMAHRHTAGQRLNYLINALWNPIFSMLWYEKHDATASAALYSQGPGNGAGEVSVINGAKVASPGLTMAAGLLTSEANLHTSSGGLIQDYQDIAFNLWRRQDGNNDPNEASVFTVGSYVGDGGASRTINTGTNTGKRPIFAIVFGDAAGDCCVRDFSHTGTNSLSGAAANNAATGITGGGIDQLNVGSVLNVNTVKYNYFILWGSATAGNGGFGVAGEYAHVEAASPTDGGAVAGTLPDEAVIAATFSDPGVVDEEPVTAVPPGDITTDIAAACVSYSTLVCNHALQRIGVNKKLTNLGTDVSQEAEVCRTFYGLVIERVLRDHPWDFATRYATLALVGGTVDTPVNGDWQYSYRSPTNMLFARRIVGQNDQKRKYDPNPIPFREGSDATGSLIYTDVELDDDNDLDVQLEYTIRLDCPARFGDATFRSAVAWRLAAEIAPSLSRDEKRQQFCLQMYQLELNDAGVTDAQEQQQEAPGDADWITGR